MTFLSLIQFFSSIKLFDQSMTVKNGLAVLLAFGLSICTAIVVGHIVRSSLRIGPILVGTSLGVAITLGTLPFVEMAIGYFHEFDVGLWLTSLLCILGALLGAYLGYRLAFVILIASQAFLSAYLVVRGISL